MSRKRPVISSKLCQSESTCLSVHVPRQGNDLRREKGAEPFISLKLSPLRKSQIRKTKNRISLFSQTNQIQVPGYAKKKAKQVSVAGL